MIGPGKPSEAFPEPALLDGLFDITDGVEPRYCYMPLNRRYGYVATADGGVLILRSAYDETLNARLKVFDVRGKWEPEEGAWRVIMSRYKDRPVRAILEDFGFEFGDDVLELLRRFWREEPSR